MSRFVRNTAFSSFAGLCTALGGLASAILAARLLGPGGSGVVIFGLWIVATTAMISDGGLSACLARFIPELTGQGKPALVPGFIMYVVRPAIILAVGVPLIMAGVAALVVDRVSWANPEATFGAYGNAAILVLCGAQTLSNLYLCTLRGLQRFDLVARLVFVSMLAQLALVLGGALLAGPAGAFGGYLAGALGPALLAFGLIRHAQPVPQELRVRVRRYALFTWAANLTSLLVWSRLEIVFLKNSFGDDAVGMYSVGLTLANLAVQGPLLFTGGLLAFFSERSDAGSHEVVEAALSVGTRLMAAIILPLSFGLCVLTPRLIPILYGPGFEPSAAAAMILITATGFGAIGTVINNLLFARERSDIMFYCNIGGGLLAVVGGFLIIPRFGLVGAAALRATVQIIMLAAGWLFVVWRLNFRLPMRDIAVLTGAALVCAVVAHLCLTLVPDLIGLPLSIVSGAISYLFSLRVFQALRPEDLRLLRTALERAPRAIRAPGRAVMWLLGDGALPSAALAMARRNAS